MKLVGNIPAPIIFGYVLDSICLYDDGENCLLYDANMMRYCFWAASAGGKGVSAIFLMIALKIYHGRWYDVTVT